jgi:hypothetical protein
LLHPRRLRVGAAISIQALVERCLVLAPSFLVALYFEHCSIVVLGER